MAQSVEELEAQRIAAESQAETQVEEAAEKARQEAESEGLKDEEVQRRVQEARKEEKDKLYPKIEEMGNTIKELQQYIRDQKAKQDEEETKREEEKEKRRLAKLSEEDRRQEELKKLEEKLEQSEQKRLEFETRLSEQRREDELKEYRGQALKIAEEDILPELVDIVRGNSKVEIDTAIIKAKTRTKEIEDRFREEHGQVVRQGLSTTSPDTEALEEEELEKRLSTVDTDKYMKDPDYRQKIQKELEGAYQRAQGR